jgi:hypothetical protein
MDIVSVRLFDFVLGKTELQLYGNSLIGHSKFRQPTVCLKHAHLYMYTYVQTYILEYIHTYIDTYIRTYIYTYIHEYIHTYSYIDTYIHTHTYIHIYVCKSLSGPCDVCWLMTIHYVIRLVCKTSLGYPLQLKTGQVAVIPEKNSVIMMLPIRTCISLGIASSYFAEALSPENSWREYSVDRY